MHALLAQMEMQHASEEGIGCHRQVEPRCVRLEGRRGGEIVQHALNVMRETGSLGSKPLLQPMAFFLDMLQACAHSGKCQWMPHESSGVESHTRFRERLIAVLPHASIKSVHKGQASGEHAYGQAACYNLAIGCQVRSNAIDSLHTSRMSAEASDYFVEDKRGSILLRDAPDFFRKLYRAEVGVAALYRFDENCSKFMGALTDD